MPIVFKYEIGFTGCIADAVESLIKLVLKEAQKLEANTK